LNKAEQQQQQQQEQEQSSHGPKQAGARKVCDDLSIAEKHQ
jgi:hypothetical protein